MASLLSALIRSPGATASVVSTSRACANAMIEPIDFDLARVVVEFGAGLGPVTRQILSKLHPDGTLIAFEINPDFVEHLCTFADKRLVVVADSAENLLDVMLDMEVSGVDAIVSTLALSTMPSALRNHILEVARDALWTHDGTLTQIQYGISTLKLDMDACLKRFFPKVERHTEVLNIPPAHVFVASDLNPMFSV